LSAEDLASDDEEFDISKTILSSAPAVVGWEGRTLEESVKGQGDVRDWNSDRDFVESNVYDPRNSSGSVYGASGGSTEGLDVYAAGRDNSAYDSIGGGAYDGKNPYDSKKGYDSQNKGGPNLKTYEEGRDRRLGKSTLENIGYEDKAAAEKRVSHDSAKYSALAA